MMKDTTARKPFGIREMNTMHVHKQEDIMYLGATIIEAVGNGAIAADVLVVSFSCTNLENNCE